MSNNTLQLSHGEIFATMQHMEHEQLVFCNDKASGLKAIVAIHDTTLGPALGGTRFWNYAKEEDAIVDVLRLSRGMTYKAAISGLNLGGGKAVIIGDSKALSNREPLFRSYGKFINGLGGRYITAEDVGTSPADIEFIQMETDHVAGKPEQLGGGGDPSPVTAYGVYLGMKAAAQYKNGSDNLSGKRVLVQGVGHVGHYLVGHLVKEGAIVMISDISQERTAAVAKEFGVEVISPDAIFDVQMDIYAPCALGATIHDESIPKLTCSIVAGAANNQLKEEEKHGRALIDRDILYAPDYLINAGGLINCYVELEGYNRERALQRTEIIYTRALEIFRVADEQKITTQAAANRVAEQRLMSIGHINARL